jgi:hypothetical protein
MSHDESVFDVGGYNKYFEISPFRLDISPKCLGPAWRGTIHCMVIIIDMTGRSFLKASDLSPRTGPAALGSHDRNYTYKTLVALVGQKISPSNRSI